MLILSFVSKIFRRRISAAQLRAKLPESLDFTFLRDPGYDVTGEAAGKRLIQRIESGVGDDRPRDGRKCVSVEVRERSHAVAAPAKVNGFGEAHFFQPFDFPFPACESVAVAGRPMMRPFVLTHQKIRCCDEPPVKRLQPLSHLLVFLAFRICSLASAISLTPTLFK